MNELVGQYPPDQEIEEIVLEKIRFGIRNVMPGSLRNELSMVSDWEIFSDSIIRQIHGYLLGNKVNTEEHDDVVKIYPATIWEELKEDFAPQWFLKRFPVRYIKEIRHRTVNNYKVCPHLDAPKNDMHIRFLTTDGKFNDRY